MEAISKDESWLGPWSGLIHCAECHALMSGSQCPGCSHTLPTDQWMTVTIDGREHKMPANVCEGALSWTGHSLLGLMKREWEPAPIAGRIIIGAACQAVLTTGAGGDPVLDIIRASDGSVLSNGAQPSAARHQC